MSSEEFWHGQPRLAGAYREAERIRRDNRDLSQWRIGVYVHHAMLAASPAFRELTKGIEYDYPKAPLFTARDGASTEEERNRALMEQGKAAFMAMANRINAKMAERDRGEEQ